MSRFDNNRLIVRCCYLGIFIQALVINLTPLLFIPLKDQLGLTYEQVGRLVLINFLTQMVVDLVCSGLVDRINVKPLTVAANLLAGAGLWVFALAPAHFSDPYTGLALGTVVFSIGCGLLEVLLSPIINAVPSERKAADMAVLHAFYPIGKVTVIIITALALHRIGAQHWRTIMLAWSVFPFINTLGFLLVRLPPFAHASTRQTLRELVRKPAFLALLLAIGLAGATELTIAQWASAFAEKGLGVSKLVGDLLGFCLFGVGMIIGRLWFGIRGEQANLRRIMIGSTLLVAAMYLITSLSPSRGARPGRVRGRGSVRRHALAGHALAGDRGLPAGRRLDVRAAGRRGRHRRRAHAMGPWPSSGSSRSSPGGPGRAARRRAVARPARPARRAAGRSGLSARHGVHVVAVAGTRRGVSDRIDRFHCNNLPVMVRYQHGICRTTPNHSG